MNHPVRNIIFCVLLVLCSSHSGYSQFTNIGNVINIYTPAISYEPCRNILFVQNSSGYKAGDTVLIIQMKGAIVDSSNSGNFGNITDYRDAGAYEINYIKSVAGNQVILQNTVLYKYNFSGKVQLVRVPYYKSARVTSTLTCKAWDGITGGVLAFFVKDTLQMQGNIDVSGKGYHGGSGKNKSSDGIGCDEISYYSLPTDVYGAEKGESFAELGIAKTGGRGPLASGGGGGNNHNSGGAGGGNGAAGGPGGNQFEDCGGNPFVNGGLGGYGALYSNTQNRIFMGGGGGGGHANNPTGGFSEDGGNGGGIVFINANTIDGNNNIIYSHGDDGLQCILDPLNDKLCTEGNGGGGAGGTILITAQKYLTQLTIDASGGKGADMPFPDGKLHGPGGGGGGGVVWMSGNSKPAAVIVNTSPGINGVNVTTSNPWGAGPGLPGQTILNLNTVYSSPLFKTNIDSVRISNVFSGCNTIDFTGREYINTSSITGWQWFFGDGDQDTGSPATHVFILPGTYTVKLVANDINNCKDSSTTKVILTSITVDAGRDTSICDNAPFQLHGIGGNVFAWSPAQYLNDSTLANPVANISVDTKFYLHSTGSNLCTSDDSILVSLRQPPVFTINTNQTACQQTPVQLNASGGDVYQWSPGVSLDDSTISNPLATPLVTTVYTVVAKDNTCNITSTLFTDVTVLPLPVVKATSTNDLDCVNYVTSLSASGAFLYTWTPAAGLSNSHIANPDANPSVNTTYIVKGKASNGCSASDSVDVKVSYTGTAAFYMPNSFTPNGDGINDCYRIKYIAAPEKLELAIYNRFGQRVFYTTSAGECWDGNFKGLQQGAGAYIYYVKAKTVCGKVEKKGTIVLVR